ncbi:MAG: glycosyltransferase family 9 protein, partial [Chloroflexi bacterium]|nr:glycosyltransferase family 9 protein [Chloroflexota bacterium]
MASRGAGGPRPQTGRERARLTVLWAAGRALGRPTPQPALPAGARLLLVRPDHLGDLLFVTPALAWLRQALPQVHLTALVGPWGQAALRGNPHLDELLTLPFPGFTRQAKGSPLAPYRLL